MAKKRRNDYSTFCLNFYDLLLFSDCWLFCVCPNVKQTSMVIWFTDYFQGTVQCASTILSPCAYFDISRGVEFSKWLLNTFLKCNKDVRYSKRRSRFFIYWPQCVLFIRQPDADNCVTKFLFQISRNTCNIKIYPFQQNLWTNTHNEIYLPIVLNLVENTYMKW